MKKFLKVTLITIGSIVAVIALVLATTSIVNVVASNSEASAIKPYGERVPVDGKQMNVAISGDGDQTVVLIPGFGTSSPTLDFSLLVKELEPTNRVVVVEPFGYGLSDPTDTERTTANIVREIHEALQYLQIDRYVLMGHSIAGIYGLDYVNQYRDEVTAFVGIDSSVPTQPNMDTEFPIGAMQTAKSLGLLRLLADMGGDAYADSGFDEATKEQMKMFANKNSMTSTYGDEMAHIGSNFKNSQSLSFPKDLPILEFIVDPDTVKGWTKLHEEQVASVDHGELVHLEGDHYLHHTQSKAIADTFATFMAELPQQADAQAQAAQ
ncbi:alpha/beta fold hydrolase [Plantibacter sp. YIM 135249]|uniref:alpha/beta fold hydrolase n=1 Tax=Plantibacter sp. YIM 135249 TaxID=3423918 RepID=UPI003D32C557